MPMSSDPVWIVAMALLGVGLLALVLGLLYGLYCGVDYLLATGYTTEPAMVIERCYTPLHRHGGVGPTIQGGVVTTVSSTPALWTVVCQLQDGTLYPFDVRQATWGRLREGTKVDVAYWRGRWSHERRGWELYPEAQTHPRTLHA